MNTRFKVLYLHLTTFFNICVILSMFLYCNCLKMLSPKFTNIVIYDEEAHWLVKVLTQRNLFEATTGVANKMEKTHKQNTSIWSSPEVKFLVQGFEVAQET